MTPDKAPVLTIITITKDSAATIIDCIDSVISQKDSSIEYIVVDGNSTDKTIELVKQKVQFIDKFISEKDSGISDAFNKGVNLATGRYIAFLNSDDYYLPGVLKEVISIILSDDLKNAPDIMRIYHGNLEMRRGLTKEILGPKALKNFKYYLPVHHPTTFVPLSLLRDFPFKEKYKIAMDYDILSMFYASGHKFTYMPTIVTSMGDEGISHRSMIKGYREVMQISRINMGVGHLESFLAFSYKTAFTKLKFFMHSLLRK